MSNEVKECPHCGGSAKVWSRMSFDRRLRREVSLTTVLCTVCGCRTQAYYKRGDAISAWNRRPGNIKSAGFGRQPWLVRIRRKILGY